MKTVRPQKRSVSPFGVTPASEGLFDFLRASFQTIFASLDGKIPAQLRSFEDARFFPTLIEKIFNAPANDAPELESLCQFLLRFRGLLEEKGLAEPAYAAMRQLFDSSCRESRIDGEAGCCGGPKAA